MVAMQAQDSNRTLPEVSSWPPTIYIFYYDKGLEN
jgi:hypothetical protein